MTNKQLEIFLAVAKLKSIKLASEYLYMSQSTISRQLALLEEELHLHLFLRRNNSLSVTEGGMVFARTCQAIRDLYYEGIKKARLIEQGEYGILSIGFANDTYWPDTLIQLLDRFRQINPNILIQYKSVPLIGFENDLKIFSSDFVIAHNLLHDTTQKLDSMPLGYAEAGLFYSNRFPLAKKNKNLTIKDFEGCTVYIRDTKYIPNIRKVEKHYNLKEFRVEVLDSAPSISLHVRLGQGAAFMDATVLEKVADDFSHIPVDRNVMCGVLYGYWNKENLNPCLEPFLKMISKHEVFIELPKAVRQDSL